MSLIVPLCEKGFNASLRAISSFPQKSSTRINKRAVLMQYLCSLILSTLSPKSLWFRTMTLKGLKHCGGRVIPCHELLDRRRRHFNPRNKLGYFRLFIVATGCPLERRPRRRLVVTGDSARIQSETTENSAWFFSVLSV